MSLMRSRLLRVYQIGRNLTSLKIKLQIQMLLHVILLVQIQRRVLRLIICCTMLIDRPAMRIKLLVINRLLHALILISIELSQLRAEVVALSQGRRLVELVCDRLLQILFFGLRKRIVFAAEKLAADDIVDILKCIQLVNFELILNQLLHALLLFHALLKLLLFHLKQHEGILLRNLEQFVAVIGVSEFSNSVV